MELRETPPVKKRKKKQWGGRQEQYQLLKPEKEKVEK